MGTMEGSRLPELERCDNGAVCAAVDTVARRWTDYAVQEKSCQSNHLFCWMSWPEAWESCFRMVTR
jgi:hypothetical protein